MGAKSTTSSSGRADTSPANVVITMTPMQAKALATLIGRSAKRGSGLDALRITLLRGASDVSPLERSSAAVVLAETKAFCRRRTGRHRGRSRSEVCGQIRRRHQEVSDSSGAHDRRSCLTRP